MSSCFIHKDINVHTTVHDETHNHSICSTICVQECTECINSCLAPRSEGASTARRTVCCDNLLPACTQAANEASPVSFSSQRRRTGSDGKQPKTKDFSSRRLLLQIRQRRPMVRPLSAFKRPLVKSGGERGAKRDSENLPGCGSCSPLFSRRKPAPHNGPVAF